MDQDFINWAQGILSAIIGWFAKTLWGTVRGLEKDLNDMKVEVAEKYVPVKRFDDAVSTINDKLDTLLERVHSKQDRQ